MSSFVIQQATCERQHEQGRANERTGSADCIECCCYKSFCFLLLWLDCAFPDYPHNFIRFCSFLHIRSLCTTTTGYMQRQ